VSNGATPFGFSFGLRDQVFVSEAFGGAPDASAVSSYVANPDGTLTLVSGSVPTTETAACWVVVTRNGRYAYLDQVLYSLDSGDHKISAFRVEFDGSLAPLGSVPAPATANGLAAR
jgi:hypothetical protein